MKRQNLLFSVLQIKMHCSSEEVSTQLSFHNASSFILQVPFRWCPSIGWCYAKCVQQKYEEDDSSEALEISQYSSLNCS